MSVQRILRSYKSPISSGRLLHQTVKDFQMKDSDSVDKASFSQKNEVSNSIMGPRLHANSNFDKWLLVWTKKFPKGQVPDKVTEEVIYQTKNRARIKASNYMIGLTIIGCFIAVFLGKGAKNRGDTIAKRHEERLAPYK